MEEKTCCLFRHIFCSKAGCLLFNCVFCIKLMASCLEVTAWSDCRSGGARRLQVCNRNVVLSKFDYVFWLLSSISLEVSYLLCKKTENLSTLFKERINHHVLELVLELVYTNDIRESFMYY